MIQVEGLYKSFKVAKQASGIKAALSSFIKRKYQEIIAISDLSFHIPEGEIVGYIGPNGAGKSTTIKILSGIMLPDRGRCYVNGYIPWKDRVHYVKHIGVIFGQRSQLWWDVPVVNSFELLRDIYKVSPQDYKSNSEMLIETLDISQIIKIPVRQLSLGQRMRCEIAAALLHNPKILFLDEPTIGLDAFLKVSVRNFIKKINQEKKTTIILTTHDMNDIEALAARVLLIGHGKILYDGTINSLRAKFGSNKTITIDYSENKKPPAIQGTKLLSWTAERASLYVNTEQIKASEVIAFLSHQFDLLDVTVENPPIEDIILELYKENQI